MAMLVRISSILPLWGSLLGLLLAVCPGFQALSNASENDFRSEIRLKGNMKKGRRALHTVSVAVHVYTIAVACWWLCCTCTWLCSVRNLQSQPGSKLCETKSRFQIPETENFVFLSLNCAAKLESVERNATHRLFMFVLFMNLPVRTLQCIAFPAVSSTS